MGAAPRTLDELLAEAAAHIERLPPGAAFEAVQSGALLVDIRSHEARERGGVVPGAIHVPRTVLEWRFEPGGSWCNPHTGDRERQVVVLCDHGYASVFAAAMLARLGYARVCDVAGGFDAWLAAGLPVRPRPGRGPDGLPGMGDPD